ncbi:MAG TPA: CehA/McbA family metallohydrolase, partial [Candidatus Limnocylindrales bacterium]
RPLEPPSAVDPTAPIGWGRFSPVGREIASPAPDRPRTESRAVVDLALAPDARVVFGSWTIEAAALNEIAVSPDGHVRIEPLPAADRRLDVRVTADGRPTPTRVRFVAADGRELPPLGHREELNPGILEDSGAGLILGSETWAYVPGDFEVDVPLGAVTVEVTKGFDHRPVRRELTIDAATPSHLDIDLDRPIDLRPAGWRSSDSHVHFLPPSTALLQAAAEDVTWVHLLATQLGDEHTSIPDLAWGGGRDPGGEHEVIVGTENRHNLLGHLALLGAQRPVLPLSSGGAPEGRIAAPTRELLADWADRCHAEGGLVVGAHFPLPFAEIAADLVAGLIDAVELQVLAPGLDNPSILEWYRFLNCGERVPIVGGTDKMSAEVPLGGIRTYAHLDPDADPTFDSWAAAVRGGRTFVTSGPVIELVVEGREPGAVLSLPRGGGRLAVDIRVRAAQPAIDAVEIVVNGRVVATQAETEPRDDVRLATTIDVRDSSWIAARSRSPFEIHSAFNTSMAAHTSPVYVEVEGRPFFVEEDAAAILEVIDGTARWLETMATVTDAETRARLAARVAASGAILRDRIAASRRGGSTG